MRKVSETEYKDFYIWAKESTANSVYENSGLNIQYKERI